MMCDTHALRHPNARDGPLSVGQPRTPFQLHRRIVLCDSAR